MLSCRTVEFVACRDVISGRVLGREGGRIPLILRGFSEKWCVYQAGAAVEFPGESAWRIYRVMGQRAESRSPARRGRYPRPGPQGRLNLETTDDADASRLFTVTLPPPPGRPSPTSGTPFPPPRARPSPHLGHALPRPRGRPSPTSGTPFTYLGDALPPLRGRPSPTSGMPFPYLGDAIPPPRRCPITSLYPADYQHVTARLPACIRPPTSGCLGCRIPGFHKNRPVFGEFHHFRGVSSPLVLSSTMAGGWTADLGYPMWVNGGGARGHCPKNSKPPMTRIEERKVRSAIRANP